MSLKSRLRDADPLAGHSPSPFDAPDVAPAFGTPAGRGPGPRRRRLVPALGVAAAAALAILAWQPGGSDSRNTLLASYAVAAPQSTDASVRILSERLDAVGDVPWSVGSSAAGIVEVSCRGCDAGAQRPVVEQVAQRGLLRIYAWEANVLGSDCRSHPSDAAVTGGPAAGTGAASLSRDGAEQRAQRCGQSAITVRAEDREGWYVLRDRPALTGRDVAGARHTTDVSGQPQVALDFTETGASRYEALTRSLAQSAPGRSPDDARHFAIVLDDEVLTVPFIDPLANPRGITDDKTVIEETVIEGGLSERDTRLLAATIQTGALPSTLTPKGG